jgi:hypothetical protein
MTNLPYKTSTNHVAVLGEMFLKNTKYIMKWYKSRLKA